MESCEKQEMHEVQRCPQGPPFPKGGRERTLGRSLGYLGFRFRYKLDFKDNFYGDNNSRFNPFQILGKLYL